MKREIILDIETTGLKPEQGHRIIEICGMEIVNGIKTGNIFHKFINPERDVPQEAYAVHGIDTEFLKDKEKFLDIASEFTNFILNSTLVIHNAKFDVGFLNYELQKISHPTIDFANVLDTLAIARKKFPGSPVSLDALCKRFKISLSKRDKHGALIDVELLHEVYKNLVDDRLLIQKEQHKLEEKELYEVKKIHKAYKEAREYKVSLDEKEAHANFLKKIKDPIWYKILERIEN